MKKSDIDRFFKEAEKRISKPVKIYLTGGVLAWFYGGARPTKDLDFALKTQGSWDQVSESLKELGYREGVPLEFSEDISRWGMVGLSDFTQGAKLYKKFGKIAVYLLDPIIWSVGKLGRFTDSDLEDLLLVFMEQKPPLPKALRLWAQALIESPRSSEHGLFAKKVKFLLGEHGKEIWGKDFDSAQAQKTFERLIQKPRRR